MTNREIDDRSWVGKNTLPPEDRGWITTIKSNTNDPDLLVDRPNWDYWSRITKLRLSQATYLSLNIAPGAMPEWPADIRCEELWRECTRRQFVVLNHIDSFDLLERAQHPLDSFISARIFAVWASGLDYILPPRFPGVTIAPENTERQSPDESHAKTSDTSKLRETPIERQDRRLQLFKENGGDFKKNSDGEFTLCGKYGAKKDLMESEKAAHHPCCDGKSMKDDLLKAFARERETSPNGLFPRR